MRCRAIGKHKTKVGLEGESLVVRYWDTAVVKYNVVERTVRLDSGGHRTLTTKKRMNQASREWKLGYWVYQIGWEWYVRFDSGGMRVFVDGMVLGRDELREEGEVQSEPALVVEPEEVEPEDPQGVLWGKGGEVEDEKTN